MATVPVFRTWVAGEVVTAAYFNANVRDAGNFFLSWPVAEIRQTVAQSIGNASFVPVTFDTNDVDTDSGHSTVTNTSRYVGKTQGRFQGSGGIGYAAGATGRRAAVWFKNGAVVNGGQVAYQATAANDCEVAAKTMSNFFLNGTTDYLELNAYQENGAALNTFVNAGSQSTMSIRMVGTT